MLIKDTLTINLSEDIKNVIDLEDASEAEIKSEIESYIITDGLAKEYADFVSIFTSNILETGVWISGFYGSGKSYFGKLLGYLLSNPKIVGTPARELILNRFSGISDEAIIKNSISKLGSENCRVVFLDVAKQDTSKGLAFTLFRNFLKSLGLPENEHGILLYQLMLNEKQSDVYDFVFKNLSIDWNDIKTRMLEYAKATKKIYLSKDNNESDYNNHLETIRRDIDQFSPARLREEIKNYYKVVSGEKIIFVFDEASEAINQKKFTLLDLEGLSEALSDSELSRKTWTIAIAQEKLDDVINNSNVSKAQLTKVTDRFKTKIHLEATEVDVIIRSRLLKKNDDAITKLKEHFKKNSGQISDHAALSATGITKTDNEESYITYYPFYKYQFDLLQNFLFGTKGYASTKVAARGMIITTYDILKNELQNGNLFETAAGWQISKEAQPQPPVRLVNRYDNAERILKENKSSINGRRLLEAIHFLSEAEVVPSTVKNISKSFVKSPSELQKTEKEIISALEILTEAKVLLDTNNTYRITSDIEQRLLDEMNNFTVQGFVKKKRIVNAYKTSTIIKSLFSAPDQSANYNFYVTTDNDDELSSPPVKQLKIKLKSIYNISDDRANDVEQIKFQNKDDKDVIWLVPDNSTFKEADKLIDDIERISYLEEKYNNPQSDEGQILKSFSTSKSEKENRLKDLVEQSMQKSTSIYLYNTFQLSKENFTSTLQTQQREVIQNVYFKRLDSQLSDALAAIVIKEAINEKLSGYFNAKDFMFFDKQGTFVGDNLKVTEEILFKMRNTFVDGATLEKDLEQPPTGFAFGTVMSSVAALMRAGKIMAKHGGAEKFSWRDEGVKDIFDKPTQFRKASFKAISKSLTAQQKNDIVTSLKDLKADDYLNRKIEWNLNDFDVINCVKDLAKYFCDKVEFMSRQNTDFDKLFPTIEIQKDQLAQFTGAVSEANYIDKGLDYLTNKTVYTEAILEIEKVEKFIRNSLPKITLWKSFTEGVADELKKSAQNSDAITNLIKEFHTLFTKDVVKNFAPLQDCAQKIKDAYYTLMESSVKTMADKYVSLYKEAEVLVKEIKELPADPNRASLEKAISIYSYAEQRKEGKVDIDFDTKDKVTRFSYSEILSFIDLYSTKRTDLDIIRASLILVELPKPIPGDKPETPQAPKKLSAKLPGKNIKVKEYRDWLQGELKKIASSNESDEIEFEN
jgi:hypothetical protein